MESSEDEQIPATDSLSAAGDAASTSSDLNSLLTSDDSHSRRSSGDASTASGSSIEIAAATTAREAEELAAAVTPISREKCVARNNRGVSWGFSSVIGRRPEMEDAVAVVPGFISSTCDHVGGCTASGSRSAGEISPVHFFGVYDGHGGSQVANYCKGRMHQVIKESLNQEPLLDNEWQTKWRTVLSNGFEKADNEVLTEAPEMVGSTAVVALVSGCQIITSNCGDSRAILCRGNSTIPLTVDQKPDREDELLRIEGGGGRVINWNGARVFGVLAMSRAIGDRYLRPWIIPVPETTFMARSDEDECLILASDGLWDVMTNDEVGEAARRLFRRWRRALAIGEGSPAQAVADNLTELAYSKNSSDNISIVVVDLKPKPNRRHRQVRQ